MEKITVFCLSMRTKARGTVQMGEKRGGSEESINKRNYNHCFWFDDFPRKERGKCFRIELAFVLLH